MGIRDHLTYLLRNWYAGQEATVRTRHGTMGWFQIRKIVRQVYILSPYLFSFYAEYIMRNGRLDEAQRFLKKVGIKPPYDPAIPLLDIHPKETKIEKDTCIPLFIAALFTIARKWKQPRCPSTDEWIRKLWYIHTMEYYSAIKRNEFESVLMRWMNLEPIIQSEVSNKEKDKYHILTHIYGI